MHPSGWLDGVGRWLGGGGVWSFCPTLKVIPRFPLAGPSDVAPVGSDAPLCVTLLASYVQNLPADRQECVRARPVS